MNGICGWCEGEGPVAPYQGDNICRACAAERLAEREKQSEREAAAAEANMPRAQRMSWMRAREAGVD